MIVPSAAPLQLTFVDVEIDAVGAEASTTFAVAVVVHPFASVTYPQYGGSYKKPEASTYKVDKKQTWGYKKDTVKVGDLVILNRPMYDPNTKKNYPADTFWEVAAVNNDYTIDLVEDEAVGLAGWLYNVPFTAIDLYEYNPELINKYYGGWGYDY